ncbi:SprT family zinc-dependent metalloprotease [Reichenbachiella versicolor]|uniref:transcription elongation protein SprT n=1 Tax=Reichenbachiella versicolor TaxID=1821036 RepID=UPI000D6E188C|nr:transcription elongation protein SprT [Reichenbachiella versicolor]
MTTPNPRALFEKFVPALAVDYCFDLWDQNGFNLKVTRSRSSKLGDYRFDQSNGIHSISVNHDLNPYSFLITYIHEVAHKINFDLHQNKVDPHGSEWKLQFKKLMIPMLREDIFPMEILAPLALHMKNPKASSVRDSNLQSALSKYDSNKKGILLKEIELGQKFLFRKKVYKKVETKRTRSVCEHLDSGKMYLIPDSAIVSGFKN